MHHRTEAYDEPTPDHEHGRHHCRPAWRNPDRTTGDDLALCPHPWPERAQAFVAQALEAEANGGMLIPDGSRRRTLGGIFFYLVRTHVSDDEAIRINQAWRWQQWTDPRICSG